jgi:hypothetical protein
LAILGCIPPIKRLHNLENHLHNLDLQDLEQHCELAVQAAFLARQTGATGFRVGLRVGRGVGRLVDRMVGRGVGRLVGRMVGRGVGRLVGRLVGRGVGRLVG